MLPRCCPLPSNLSPGGWDCWRGFTGHPQHPAWASSPTPRSARLRGSVCLQASKPASRLSRASRRGKPGLGVADLKVSGGEEQCPRASSAQALSVCDPRSLSLGCGCQLTPAGSPNPAFPFPSLTVAGQPLRVAGLGPGLWAVFQLQLVMENYLGLGASLLRPSCAGAAHPQEPAEQRTRSRGSRVGLFGFCGVLASVSQPSWEKWKGCLLWHRLYSPISSSSSIPVGAGDTCLGSPRQARASLSGNLGHAFGPGADSLLWANSYCLAPSRARRLRAGSASGFQLLPFHCNLSGGASSRCLRKPLPFFFKDWSLLWIMLIISRIGRVHSWIESFFPRHCPNSELFQITHSNSGVCCPLFMGCRKITSNLNTSLI